MRLARLDGAYAVARAAADAPVPAGLLEGAGFRTVARTPDELSAVFPEAALPGLAFDRVEGGWACFQVAGPLAFTETGIVAGISAALAEAGIGIFVVSTYDTDYVLVKAAEADRAVAAWRAAGHDV